MSDGDLIRLGDVLALPFRLSPSLDAADGYYVSVDAIRGLSTVKPWNANCIVCGRVVDTREESEGGDAHGCEYADGWVCSRECDEIHVTSKDQSAASPGVTAGAAFSVEDKQIALEAEIVRRKLMSDYMLATNSITIEDAKRQVDVMKAILANYQTRTIADPDVDFAWEGHQSPAPSPDVQALVDALVAVVEWDKTRRFIIPYRVRDPIYKALAHFGVVK